LQRELRNSVQSHPYRLTNRGRGRRAINKDREEKGQEVSPRVRR